MKTFHAILLCAVVLISSQRPCAAASYKNPSALRRQLDHVETSGAFDYSASPSATATSKCALINALVNETSTTPAEHAWLKDTDIPQRISRYSADGSYDHVFVCGSGCGKPVSDPSLLLYRFMGCTRVSTGTLANPDVTGWTNRTADVTFTHTLTDRIHDALEHTMDSLPSSIEGIDLLATCQQFDRNLVFVTTEYEEWLDAAFSESGAKAEIQNNGYILDAISHWSNESYVGTYVY